MTDYHARAIIEGVDWLTEDNKTILNVLIPSGQVQFEGEIHQIHLAWPLTSATLDDAIRSARVTLNQARRALSLLDHEASSFEVRRSGDA